MGTAERRREIMRILCRRRYETIANLAYELGVSQRTILRDIEKLSIKEPIYTQCGRYGGGVYVCDKYIMERMYMTEQELSVLHKLMGFVQTRAVCELDMTEIAIFKNLITQYTKKS
ncbi:MAG: HTH domain-containing protein [Clostridia bacterium]|nr:HTH domain-containing protein [Clostridia bacterium]